MLGEMIGEDKGRVTNRRVIEDEHGLKVETSFEGAGTFYGIEGMGFGTYLSELRADGTLYGTGQGVIMGKNNEKLTWRGGGIGWKEDDGTMRFRGSVYYFSDTTNWKKANRIAGVYEHDVLPDGTVTNKIWEWK